MFLLIFFDIWVAYMVSYPCMCYIAVVMIWALHTDWFFDTLQFSKCAGFVVEQPFLYALVVCGRMAIHALVTCA